MNKLFLAQIAESGETSGADSAIGMLMNLRKTANHPLLVGQGDLFNFKLCIC